MEWNRRAEQGERGRRRAFVLEALPCSRLQHNVLQYPDAIKKITLHVLIILKFASTRSGAKIEPSPAPQAHRKSYSSAGLVAIRVHRRVVVDIVSSAGS